MSYFVGGAIVVSAVAGAYSADKAADKQAKGVQKGLDQSSALAKQAREDVMRLFADSSQKAGIGLEQAFDYYKANAPKRIEPFMQGNQSAQNVLGQGAVQANNAILGLPVDMSFTNQPQVQVPQNYLGPADLPGTIAQQTQGPIDLPTISNTGQEWQMIGKPPSAHPVYDAYGNASTYGSGRT